MTLEYPPLIGGVADYYENMVKSWPAEDEIFVLDNSRNELVSKAWPVGWMPAIWTIVKKVRKEKIDNILVGQILPLGTAALIVSWLMGIRYSVFLHGMDFTFALKAGRKKRLAKAILKNAQRVICANSYVAGLASAFGGGQDSIGVVNPGIDTSYVFSGAEQARRKYGLEGKKILLSLGRMVERKGFDKVLESLPAVIAREPRSAYVLAGSGPELARLKKLAAELDVADIVTFAGEIKDEEKMALLEACDVFIMPSRSIGGDFEGFGIVYLEANLAGRPVIAGDSGGVRDAVIDGLNGFLVDPTDTRKIAEKILTLFKDASLRERLGRQGRERAIKDFDWTNQAKKINQMI